MNIFLVLVVVTVAAVIWLNVWHYRHIRDREWHHHQMTDEEEQEAAQDRNW